MLNASIKYYTAKEVPAKETFSNVPIEKSVDTLDVLITWNFIYTDSKILYYFPGNEVGFF